MPSRYTLYILLIIATCLYITAPVKIAAETSNSIKTDTLQKTPSTIKKEFDLNFNSPTIPEGNMIILSLLALIAGVLSFLSPCTLPILPAYFAVTFQSDRKQIVSMGIFFFLGLATLFVMMGASASLLGSFIRRNLASLTTGGGILIIIFGVMTFLGHGFTGMNFQSKQSATYFGSFLFGSTFALGWTPCIGPVLTGILILAATANTVYKGMILLFIYAVGLGIPLILISLIFGNINKNSWFWKLLKGKGMEINIFGKSFLFHTTSMITGCLLVFLGVLMSTGYITSLNNYLPIELQLWFDSQEKNLLQYFSSGKI